MRDAEARTDLRVGPKLQKVTGWAGIASPLWVASGIMGITELVRPGIHWGPIAGFTLGGAALAVTGAFVLWGLPTRDPVDGRAIGMSR